VTLLLFSFSPTGKPEHHLATLWIENWFNTVAEFFKMIFEEPIAPALFNVTAASTAGGPITLVGKFPPILRSLPFLPNSVNGRVDLIVFINFNITLSLYYCTVQTTQNVFAEYNALLYRQ
jgi:hypothetical protein